MQQHQKCLQIPSIFPPLSLLRDNCFSLFPKTPTSQTAENIPSVTWSAQSPRKKMSGPKFVRQYFRPTNFIHCNCARALLNRLIWTRLRDFTPTSTETTGVLAYLFTFDYTVHDSISFSIFEFEKKHHFTSLRETCIPRKCPACIQL